MRNNGDRKPPHYNLKLELHNLNSELHNIWFVEFETEHAAKRRSFYPPNILQWCLEGWVVELIKAFEAVGEIKVQVTFPHNLMFAFPDPRNWSHLLLRLDLKIPPKSDFNSHKTIRLDYKLNKQISTRERLHFQVKQQKPHPFASLRSGSYLNVSTEIKWQQGSLGFNHQYWCWVIYTRIFWGEGAWICGGICLNLNIYQVMRNVLGSVRNMNSFGLLC